MRIIESGKPYLVPTENGILQRGHIVGGKNQLCTLLVDLLALKEGNNIAQQLWMELRIQFINNNRAALQ